MATINASTNEKIIPLKKWLGLNQAPDGDTMLKVGEASVMKNWRVTRDGNLKRRPGLSLLYGLSDNYYAVVSDEATRVSITSSTRTEEVFTGYTVDTNTGVITLTGTLGEKTSAEARTLLENAAVSQYYYFEWAGNKYRLDSVANSRGRDTTRMVWYGKLVYGKTNTDPDAKIFLWTGYVGGQEQFVAVYDGYLLALWNPAQDEFYVKPKTVGLVAYWAQGDDKIPTQVSFLPFDNKLYILTDKEYFVWDGSHDTGTGTTPDYSHCQRVAGYVPLIATSLAPDANSAPGSYELLEAVNRLTGVRRVWLSPDGTGTVFHLPENNIASVQYVNDLSTDPPTELAYNTDYTYDLTAGTITFLSVPAEGVNSYEVQYYKYGVSADESSTYMHYRNQVVNNAYSELYSGKTDTVIFLYGDGSNKCIYSGMDYDGKPRADYFPDLNDIAIGDENTPITQLIRHSSALLAFKKDSAWAIQQDLITLADGSQTFGYYVSPVNKAVGHEAPGQAQLVDNDPITLFNRNIYRWKNSSYYSSNLARDERQARVISERVQELCRGFDMAAAVMWDDNDHQELYISNRSDLSIVWNYARDAWYEYDIGPDCFINFRGDLYVCAGSRSLYLFDEDAESDEGVPIHAEWVSGAMDFGVGYGRKYSSMLWVGLKPETGTSVDVTVRTDRKNTFKDKIVPSYKAKVPGEPFMVKTKIKAKKFVYYRLILDSNEMSPPVTVTSAEIRVRMTGYAK